MHTSESETTRLWGTFLATLFVELEFAIFVGVFMSIIIYLRYSSKPIVTCCVPDETHPKRKFICSKGKEQCPQLGILKIDGSIFFGSVDNLEERFRTVKQKNLLLIFAGVSLIDLAGIDFLKNIMKDKRKDGGDIFISNVNSFVMRKMEKSGFTRMIGKDHMFESKPEAIPAIIAKLDKEVCKKCQARIFTECK